jgi:hypothetical protein
MKEVKRAGDEMADRSKIFADDPCSKTKREQMITAARVLLTSVTRLLLLADRADVQLILKSIALVEKDLQLIFKASNQDELMQFYKQYGKDVNELNLHTQRRQQVNDFRVRNEKKQTSSVFQGFSRSYGTRKSSCGTCDDQTNINDVINLIENLFTSSGEFFST